MCLLYQTLYTDNAPAYTGSMVSLYTPGRALRSASATVRLAVPLTRLARAGRCFSVSTLLSGMRGLPTFITIGHSRLLKHILKPIYSRNILVKH